MHNKRWIALVLCLVFLFNLSCSVAESIATPRTQAGTTLNAYIATSGSTVNGRGKCTVLPGYTALVAVCIQKRVSGFWVNVSTATGISTATTSAEMEAGYTYRVYTYCRVCDANGDEYDSAYAFSGTVSY